MVKKMLKIITNEKNVEANVEINLIEYKVVYDIYVAVSSNNEEPCESTITINECHPEFSDEIELETILWELWE